VGQRFVQLLADHPWFEVVAVTGSERTAGGRYGDVVRWMMPGPMPEKTAALTVQPTSLDLEVGGRLPIVFSALPTTEAQEWEAPFAAAGFAVVTNASTHRMGRHIPLLIPEINPDHTCLIPTQQTENNWPGFIVASPNCATTSAILPLKILHETFGVTAAIITTMQAISGAGYPGVASLDVMDNVVPYIGGEDDKLENEPKKLLGEARDGRLLLADLRLSAQTNRVPVVDGHLASVSVQLERPPAPAEAIAALESWTPPAISRQLPSSPDPVLVYRHEPDRPQPRRDRDTGNGMAWTVGKVRPCGVLDLRYLSLTHNTLRGAASGALLNAELLKVQGYIG
jgi:aspartate-semialdehyde dehydrogenase